MGRLQSCYSILISDNSFYPPYFLFRNFDGDCVIFDGIVLGFGTQTPLVADPHMLGSHVCNLGELPCLRPGV